MRLHKLGLSRLPFEGRGGGVLPQHYNPLLTTRGRIRNVVTTVVVENSLPNQFKVGEHRAAWLTHPNGGELATDFCYLGRANKRGQKRRWETVSESNGGHRVEKKQKPTRPEEINTREQLTIFTDSTVSSMLTLPSDAKGYDGDAEYPIVPDLSYAGASSPDSIVSCSTGDSTSTQCYYDVADFPSSLDFLEIDHDINSKEFADIPIVDLTEDRPVAYDDLLSQYTTILSSACSSIKGASDDDDNKRLSDLASDKPCSTSEMGISPIDTANCNLAQLNQIVQIKPKKSGIRLRLNPPKLPMPKILLRVKQPEQLLSQKCRSPVRKNDRRVRNSGKRRTRN
ncbi:MAG: hypothetical protein M1813_006009 [Trichoglossum hirsutum]|nr:MAG: hypothetical protein M1813_006009 [Trichoglossum hirsutum]